jgi:hypothetical protein
LTSIEAETVSCILWPSFTGDAKKDKKKEGVPIDSKAPELSNEEKSA